MRYRLVLIGVAAIGGPLGAAEYCVTCTGPEATYACRVDAGDATSLDAALKLYCITELAKSGPHASCSVDRSKTAPCQGVARTLAAPPEIFEGLGNKKEAASPATPAAAPDASPANETYKPYGAPEQAGAPNGDGKAADSATPKPAPPKTVQDLVKDGADATEKSIEKTGEAASDAAKSAGNALDNAGTAIGNAAKKSWKCLSSFFGDC